MRTKLFTYFCMKKYIGTQGEFCRQLKIILTPPPPPIVYATDRSKAVVPVFFVLYVAFWFILRGAPCFLSCPVLFVLVFRRSY